mgnify:CR=1 FL=1
MSDIENPTGDTRPIGVFDSGLGGLTVARAIATVLPRESVYYFGDTKRCPYGTRTEDEVRSFALQAGRWLSKHDVKIMVIACNTATAAALRLAQQVLDVPVIGVIAPGAVRQSTAPARVAWACSPPTSPFARALTRAPFRT